MRFFSRRDREAIRSWLSFTWGDVRENLAFVGYILFVLFWMVWVFLNFVYLCRIAYPPGGETREKLEKPTSEMFVEKDVLISDLVGCDRLELWTADLDGDGDVDALHYYRAFEFVDEEFMEKYRHEGGSNSLPTRTMTPELKETLTRIVRDTQEARVMIAEASYEAEQDWLVERNKVSVRAALEERSRKAFLYIQVILLLGCLIILFYTVRYVWRDPYRRTRKAKRNWAIFLVLFEAWSLVILWDTVATFLWLLS